MKLLLGKLTSDRASLLNTDILWLVLGASKFLAGCCLLLLVVHSQSTSNVFAHALDLSKLGWGRGVHLQNTESCKLLAQVTEATLQGLLGEIPQLLRANLRRCERNSP